MAGILFEFRSPVMDVLFYRMFQHILLPSLAHQTLLPKGGEKSLVKAM